MNGTALEIVTILAEEGFGILAAELLTELEGGGAVGLDAGVVDDPSGPIEESLAAQRIRIQLEGGIEVFRAYAEHGVATDADGKVEGVPVEAQFGYAVDFLRRRLVEPLLALEEAEVLADELLRSGGRSESGIETTPTPFGASEPAMTVGAAGDGGSTGPRRGGESDEVVSSHEAAEDAGFAITFFGREGEDEGSKARIRAADVQAVLADLIEAS